MYVCLCFQRSCVRVAHISKSYRIECKLLRHVFQVLQQSDNEIRQTRKSAWEVWHGTDGSRLVSETYQLIMLLTCEFCGDNTTCVNVPFRSK